jgi:hypothetical protein
MTGLDQALILMHQKLSHLRCTQILAREFSRDIIALALETARHQDVGCGCLSLAWAFSEVASGGNAHGVDIHSSPNDLTSEDPTFRDSRRFDGNEIPLDVESFGVILFFDILQYTPARLRQNLLRSVG